MYSFQLPAGQPLAFFQQSEDISPLRGVLTVPARALVPLIQTILTEDGPAVSGSGVGFFYRLLAFLVTRLLFYL